MNVHAKLKNPTYINDDLRINKKKNMLKQTNTENT